MMVPSDGPINNRPQVASLPYNVPVLSAVSQGSQVRQVPRQLVTIMRLQRVVLHHVLPIINRTVQLTLFVVSFLQVAIEFRKMVLHVVIALALLLIVAREIRGALQIVLHLCNYIPQFPDFSIFLAEGCCPRSRNRGVKQTFSGIPSRYCHSAPPGMTPRSV